ncbi:MULTISPECIES: restriction endonuclease [Kocuria]|uniref:nSTAND3 domain-containing NTPase n=1 Tax=Kocuria TaxID=57493 RepID=UPI0011A67E72|nr:MULTISPECIES: restriction endonuclease [Kocuria]
MSDYDFRSLSPIDFEQFVRDLLNADLGTRFVSFAVGPDGGVDLRDTSHNQEIIAQCKHRPDAKKGELAAMAKAETSPDRWQNKNLSKYYFVVSAPMTPAVEQQVKLALAPLPVDSDSVWHQGSLNAALARQPHVEESHFKLWLSSATVLGNIIDAALWKRSEELLQRVSERVKLYVHTPAYAQASDILKQESVVIISGAPGVGKSTLAEMMLLALWNQGWTVVNIASDIQEAWRNLKVQDEKIVFFYDDFLGQTNVAEMQKNEAPEILALMDLVRKSQGKKLLILTTREQVLGQVESGGDDRARRIAKDRAKMRVELKEIDRSKRAQILFNHLHFGFSDKTSRRLLAHDVRYRDVVDHQGFNPRVLESVILRQDHKNIDSFYATLMHSLDHPEDIWSGSFRQLSTTAVDILFQIASCPPSMISLEELREFVSFTDAREWNSALKVLENTWVRLVSKNKQKNPGVVDTITLFDASRRDFLLDLLNDPAYFDMNLDKLSSLKQLNYLLRLANLLGSKITRTNTSPKVFLTQSFKRRSNEIDQISAYLAKKDLERATRKKQNSQEKIEVLIRLATVCFDSKLPTIESESFLYQQLDGLLQVLGQRNYMRTSSIFKLSSLLATDLELPHFEKYAFPLARLAIEEMDDLDGLEAYFELPDVFREDYLDQLAKVQIQNVFDWELESIDQENDPELMRSLLDDLEMLAHINGYEIDSEALSEKIESLEDLEEMRRADRAQDGYFMPAPSEYSSPSDGNEELQELFKKLI